MPGKERVGHCFPMISNIMKFDYLAPREVARLLKVSPVTVRAWASKGWLRAEVTPGGHRRFSLKEVERMAREHGIKLAHTSQPKPLRVLIVDDDRQFAGYLKELLGESAETELAHDGFDAGHKVSVFAPDVVLLDLMMPGMDGFEACRRIKQAPPTHHIRVIAVTGYPSPDNLQRALECGAECCLGKPLDVAALRQAIGEGALPIALE